MKIKTLVAAMAAVLAVAACSKKSVMELESEKEGIDQDSRVKFHYTLIIDGKVMESSVGKEPLTYIHGSHMIVSGLEEALKGMKVGEKKQVVVTPEKGYGVLDPKLIQKVSRAEMPSGAKIEKGFIVSGVNQGRMVQARVVDFDKDSVTLDSNPPLAGKTLTFDIEIADIQ